MGKSIPAIRARSPRTAPSLIERMSFRLAIPWQVALPQSPPPLHQPTCSFLVSLGIYWRGWRTPALDICARRSALAAPQGPRVPQRLRVTLYASYDADKDGRIGGGPL